MQVDRYDCVCAVGFTGPLCGIPVNECESVPCMNGGTCHDEHAGYTCHCLQGFTGALAIVL